MFGRTLPEQNVAAHPNICRITPHGQASDARPTLGRDSGSSPGPAARSHDQPSCRRRRSDCDSTSNGSDTRGKRGFWTEALQDWRAIGTRRSAGERRREVHGARDEPCSCTSARHTVRLGQRSSRRAGVSTDHHRAGCGVHAALLRQRRTHRSRTALGGCTPTRRRPSRRGSRRRSDRVDRRNPSSGASRLRIARHRDLLSQ